MYKVGDRFKRDNGYMYEIVKISRANNTLMRVTNASGYAEECRVFFSTIARRLSDGVFEYLGNSLDKTKTNSVEVTKTIKMTEGDRLMDFFFGGGR